MVRYICYTLIISSFNLRDCQQRDFQVRGIKSLNIIVISEMLLVGYYLYKMLLYCSSLKISKMYLKSFLSLNFLVIKKILKEERPPGRNSLLPTLPTLILGVMSYDITYICFQNYCRNSATYHIFSCKITAEIHGVMSFYINFESNFST